MKPKPWNLAQTGILTTVCALGAGVAYSNGLAQPHDETNCRIHKKYYGLSTSDQCLTAPGAYEDEAFNRVKEEVRRTGRAPKSITVSDGKTTLNFEVVTRCGEEL